jgi:hypothetical protein
VALTPSVVGVPLARAEKAIDNAVDAVDAGSGAGAVGPLRASRRYLIRAYRGARYLIAQTAPVPADDARAAAATRRFGRLARRSVRASRSAWRARVREPVGNTIAVLSVVCTLCGGATGPGRGNPGGSGGR